MNRLILVLAAFLLSSAGTPAAAADNGDWANPGDVTSGCLDGLALASAAVAVVAAAGGPTT